MSNRRHGPGGWPLYQMDRAATVAGFRSRSGRPMSSLGQTALRGLSSALGLSEEERDLIRLLSLYREIAPAGCPLDPDGLAPHPRLILQGWACRQRVLSDGQRQIFSFLLPGDCVGLSGEPRALDGTAIVAVTRVETADAAMLREILTLSDPRHDRLRRGLAQARLYEEVCLLNHVVRLGRQSALARMGHLFLELRDRLSRAGLCYGERFHLPLTQEILADALGLSLVHVGRTVGRLRREGLIAFDRGWLSLLDDERLAQICDYRSDYPMLH